MVTAQEIHNYASEKVVDKSTIKQIMHSEPLYLWGHIFDTRQHAGAKIAAGLVFGLKAAIGLAGGPPGAGLLASLLIGKAESTFKSLMVNKKLSANLEDIKFLVKNLSVDTLDTHRYKTQHSVDATFKYVSFASALWDAADKNHVCVRMYEIAISFAQARRRLEIFYASMRVLIEVGNEGIRWHDSLLEQVNQHEKKFTESLDLWLKGEKSQTNRNEVVQALQDPRSTPWVNPKSSRPVHVGNTNSEWHKKCGSFCIHKPVRRTTMA